MFNMIDNKLNVRIIFFPIVMKVGHIRQIVKHNCNVEISVFQSYQQRNPSSISKLTIKNNAAQDKWVKKSPLGVDNMNFKNYTINHF